MDGTQNVRKNCYFLPIDMQMHLCVTLGQNVSLLENFNCSENHWTSFYVTGTSVRKELNE